VDRTTNGHGAVSAMTYEELRRLGVPSFEEALELARGKIGVYIDAKSISAQDLVTAVAKYGLDDRVVIYGGLALHREIRKLNPRIRVMPEAGSVESVRRVVDELHPQVIAFDARDFQDDVIAIAKAAGAELYVDRLGPADNPQSWEDAVRRGASGIQTDHPAELVELLRSRGWHR
jgi:glycerophosphoryl diester phosphodiesterase